MMVTAARGVLGRLQGFIVDPLTRRLRFLVVKTHRLGRSRLVPVGGASIDVGGRAIELLDDEALDRSQPFSRGMFPAFSDEDVVTAMFATRTAA